MASALSDDELRRKLQEMGENVGPVTRTTRKVWEKKLEKAMQEQKKNRHTITRSTASHLGHFSSDESEDALCTETSSHRHRYPPGTKIIIRRRRIIGSNQPSDNSPNRYDSNTDDSNTFKIPDTPVTRTLNKSANTSNTSPSNYISGLARPAVRTSQRTNYSTINSFDIDSSDSDIDSDHFRRSGKKGRQSDKTGINENTNSRLISDWNNCLRKDEQFHNGNKSEMQVSTGLNHISLKANGYTSDENTLWNTFKTEDDSRMNTNYSQWISMFLVVVATLFFVIVGILYVGVKQKDLPSDENYNLPSCSEMNTNENSKKCTAKEHFTVQNIVWRIYDLLAEAKGQYQCNERSAEPHLSCKEIKQSLLAELKIEEGPEFVTNFNTALWMIANNKKLGIKLYDEDERIIVNVKNVHDIHALETAIASKSLRCRLQQAFLQSSIELLCCLCGILIIIGTVFLIKTHKRKKLLEEKKMYAVVERIIDILKQQNEKCQGNSDCEPVLAIAHVRDMLIPPAERKLYQELWDKAVKFLEENESRVRTERQHIAGEDFLVWRWLQPSTPEIGGKYGKVWQGQAFENTGKGINSLPFSPTPCLKIRNMFDPEVEYGDDWQVFITDAILEKCENNNNIVHVKVDTSSNEGCVYLKCTTAEAAGHAYRALHGWWFDRKLVTVKYLRLERYHERFPESKNCCTPMKPSNNMRLSLSAPFHSSALESS